MICTYLIPKQVKVKLLSSFKDILSLKTNYDVEDLLDNIDFKNDTKFITMYKDYSEDSFSSLASAIHKLLIFEQDKTITIDSTNTTVNQFFAKLNNKRVILTFWNTNNNNKDIFLIKK